MAEANASAGGAASGLEPGESTPATRKRLGGAALRTFDGIADAWGLTTAQRRAVMGQPAPATYHAWLRKARSGHPVAPPLDVLLRVSAVLGIYKDLQILFPDDEAQRAWLLAPNAGNLFGGQAPIALITSGTQDGLMLVRRYLDAWRGGRFAAPVGAVDDSAALTESDIVFV